MKNKSKNNVLVLWILFFVFSVLGVHALYAEKLKEFYIRLIVIVGMLITVISMVISMIVIGDANITRAHTSFNLKYSLTSSNLLFVILPTVFF